MSFTCGLGASLECSRPAVDCINERIPACCKTKIAETRWQLQQWNGNLDRDVFDEEIVPKTPRMPEAPRLLTSQKLLTQFSLNPGAAKRHGRSKEIDGEFHPLEGEDDVFDVPQHPTRADVQGYGKDQEADDSSRADYVAAYAAVPEELLFTDLQEEGSSLPLAKEVCIASLSTHGPAEPFFIPQPGIHESAIAMIPDVNEEPHERAVSAIQVMRAAPEIQVNFETEQPRCTERYGITWVEDVEANEHQQVKLNAPRIVEPADGLVSRLVRFLGDRSSVDQRKGSPPPAVLSPKEAYRDIMQGKSPSRTFVEEGKQRLAQRMDAVSRHVQDGLLVPVAASQSASSTVSIDPAAEAFAEAGRARLRERMDSVYKNVEELQPVVPPSPLLPPVPPSPTGSSCSTPTNSERRGLGHNLKCFPRHEKSHAPHSLHPPKPADANTLVSQMDGHLSTQMKSVVEQLANLKSKAGDSPSSQAPTPASPVGVEQAGPRSPSLSERAAREQAETERAQERMRRRLEGTYEARRPASPEGKRDVSPASSSSMSTAGSRSRFQLPGKLRSRAPSPSGMRVSMHAVLSNLEAVEKQVYGNAYTSFIRQGSVPDCDLLREFLMENTEIGLGQLEDSGLIRQLNSAKLLSQDLDVPLEDNPFFQGFLEILQELPLSTEMCMSVFAELSPTGKSAESEACKERAGQELMSKYQTKWPWFRWEALLDAAFDGKDQGLNKDEWLTCFKRAARMARILRYLKI